VPGDLSIIDTVNPETQRSDIYGHTLEQIQERHPGAIIGDLAEWAKRHEESFLTEPVEIDEKKFDEMLNVLPPKRWVTEGDVAWIRRGNISRRRTSGDYRSSFEMIEHQSGRVTSFFITIGDRYFTYDGIAGTPHAEKVKRCADKFGIVL